MAVDENIPRGVPGVADYQTRTYGNLQELLYSDTPPLAQVTIDVTATGADLTIGLYSVIATDGTPAVQTEAAAADRANYIAATEITILDGETKSVPVYTAGHFTMDALVWDASYDTDAKKKAAFQGSVSPTILVSKAKHNSDAIYS
jgi:hypothetical protein